MVCQGNSRLAHLGRAWSLQEIHCAVSYNCAVAFAVEQQRSLFVNRNAVGKAGPAVVVDPAKEGEIAAHAVASDEVRVIDESLQDGDVDEVLSQSDVLVVRIRKSLRGSNALARERCVDELREHIHARAGAAGRHTLSDQVVQSRFDRSSLPEVDVIRLITARDP